ncbi:MULTISPECIES: flavodoxin domain-containing protein [Haloferax]|uniref:Protoporphyrinogen oxidase n=2 Tax=Haloferax TaxID=2251 RepID=A0A6G1Z1G9_9EURY|nr:MULTISPECIES: flavodoxin domain-containing protein [Haloferax]KAB1187629.1 protoporphyrinogen oxidase [Haloferax sp. CBA1149]MRW80288.1 protoporphyrinogen oxidase [Haloferax marinisediminis]
MVSILVVYESGEGQTAKVSEYVENVLTARGHDVTVRRVADAADVDVTLYDAVLVGSPVHYRTHLPEVVEFIEANLEALSARPNGFFQLSLASTIPLKVAQRGDDAYVDSLVTKTGWQPDHVGRFAGAVTYSQYNPVERMVFKLLAAVTTGDTDTSRDYEYTDWDDVDAFATAFADDVEARLERDTATRRHAGTRRFTWAATGVVLLLGVMAFAYWAAARQFVPAEC